MEINKSKFSSIYAENHRAYVVDFVSQDQVINTNEKNIFGKKYRKKNTCFTK